MTKRSWLAMSLALVLLAAIPAQAGTKTTSSQGTKGTKASGIRKSALPPGGFLVQPLGEPQIKIFWCDPGLQGLEPAHAEDDLPTQPAGQLLNFGLGWAVMEEPQSVRSRDIQNGGIWLEHQISPGVWETLYDLQWIDGRWVDGHALEPAAAGDYAWSDPYEWSTPGGLAVWRIDWELPVTLPAGTYAFSHIDFQLSKGSNQTTGGDPPGPYYQYGDCIFTVA